MFTLPQSKPKAPRAKGAAKYERKKQAESQRRRHESRAGREIAPCPEVKDPKRRKAAINELEFYLRVYFPGTFTLPFSRDQKKLVHRLQEVITDGGQHAFAMPRGSGKTSILERANIWAIKTGRRRFAVLITANEALAEQSVGRIKAEIERNPLLLEDFPKMVYPMVMLEGENRRAGGQLHDGIRTAPLWQRKRLVFPTMPGPSNEGSGSVLQAAGIGAAVRGLAAVDREGNTFRPDFLMVDDPQDRESAHSTTQCIQRLALLNGDLLGLAGPGKKIAAFTAGTVIYRNDLIDQLLDHSKSPAWTGERFKLIYSLPSRTDLWERYAELRHEGFEQHDDGVAATEFYRQNKAAMDAGANPAWPERFNPGELSAVQNAMNLKIDNRDGFNSEYQNEPEPETAYGVILDPDAIAQRLSGFDRGICGPDAEKITAGIDVGQGLLWWVVAAWSTRFDCEIIDYGTFPDQPSRVFTARNAPRTLDQAFPEGGVDGMVYAGLQAIVDRLARREWIRSDGATLGLNRMLIDSGWATDAVRAFTRQSDHRHLMHPSKGMGIGPGQTAIAEYRKRPGEKIGNGWILGAAGPDRQRLLRFDANLWKTRMAALLTRPQGARGGALLYGKRPAEHQLMALHLCSETPIQVNARGVTSEIWKRRPDSDNHWLDAAVLAAVAAAMEGISPLAGNEQGQRQRPAGQRKLRSISDLMAHQRGEQK